MAGRRSRRSEGVDYWPGFVDALSTLLIAIIFIVLLFTLAQYFLNQALSGRDDALEKLNQQVAQLADLLALEKGNNAELQLQIGRLTADLQSATAARDEAVNRLAGIMTERDGLATRLAQANGRIGELQALSQKQASDLQTVTAARDEALNRLAGVMSERDGLSTRLAENTGRLGELQALSQKQVADLEAANKVIAADREKIEAQLKDLASLKADIDALRVVRADLEKQVASLAAGLKDRETELGAVRDRAKELETRLATSEERTQLAQRDIAQRDIRLAELLARGEVQASQLGREKAMTLEAQRQVELLNSQITAFREQLARIEAALEASETKSKEQEAQIVDLGRRLNLALASKVEELARYRSEFFGRLREALGERPDVRIVGDRFIFQSEVLFDPGSAELGEAGRQQIASLATTLKELAGRIPSDLNWVLRVDGHTDRVPIKTFQFPSNWELSTARAIAVVKFMIEQGVSPDRLAATGFGEYQPLDPRDDDQAKRRNRRIELKLTER